jgi:hypothetical protein
MALRLIEMVLLEKDRRALEELLTEKYVLDVWIQSIQGGRMFPRTNI